MEEGVLASQYHPTYLAGSRQRFSQLQQFAIRLNIAVSSPDDGNQAVIEPGSVAPRANSS